MAQIKPFQGVRFTKAAGAQGELLCPPYDIISEAQRQAYIRRNPNNIIRIELPEGGEERYQKAGELLRGWLDSGVMQREEKDSLYVYELEFADAGAQKKIRGLFCLVQLEPFSAGVVLPHEETLPKAKSDRLNLIQETHANISPIFSLFHDAKRETDAVLDQICTAAPDVSVTDEDGVVHRMWITSDEAAIAALTAVLADKKLYIADGHHRYETALNYQKYLREQGKSGANEVLMTIMSMDSPDLTVYPTHRLITLEGGFELGRVLNLCAEHFDIVRFDTPVTAATAKAWLDAEAADGLTSFMLYSKTGYAGLRLKDARVMEQLLPDASAAYRGLDVSVLHSLILEKELGIDAQDLASQKSVRYSRDIQECMDTVVAGGADCAFLISATRVDEIAQVAAAGEKMPQKSTYFYPKLITGLVINVH